MYNTTLVCTYNDLSSYQTLLLKILDTDEIGLTGQIEVLYERVKDNKQIETLLQKLNGQWPPDLAFCILFSYEFFEHTHRFLCEILMNQPSVSYEKLYELVNL
jgi:hypothetical protein